MTHSVKPREAVLILAHGDGFVEVFADSHVDVRIEIAPFVGAVNGEKVVEEYVEKILPPRFGRLFWPAKRRAIKLIRKIRPTDIAQRDYEVELLKSIDRAGQILRGGHQEGRTTWIL
jgi:hypothetical protein